MGSAIGAFGLRLVANGSRLAVACRRRGKAARHSEVEIARNVLDRCPIDAGSNIVARVVELRVVLVSVEAHVGPAEYALASDLLVEAAEHARARVVVARPGRDAIDVRIVR